MPILIMIFFFFSCNRKDILVNVISNSFINVVSPIGICGGGFLSYGNKKYLVSASHCYDKDISLFDGKDFYFEDLNVILNDEKSDLLILEVSSKELNRKMLRYKEESLNILDKVYYLCSPNGLPPVMIEGHISRIEEDFYMLQSFAWSGCSGSLVFSRKGNVIGVVSAIIMSDIPGLPLENLVAVPILSKKNFGR